MSSPYPRLKEPERNRVAPPNERPIHAVNDKGIPVCGALRRDGGTCQSHALMDNGRCRMHGGTVPRGSQAPGYTGQGYSRYLPKELQQSVAAALLDPNLLEMSEALAVLDARMGQLLQRVEEGAGREAWRTMSALLQQALREISRSEMVDALVTLNQALDLTRTLLAESSLWEDVNKTLEQRRKIVETEMKRRLSAENIVTKEQLGLYHAVIAKIILDAVPEGRVRDDIAHKLAALAGLPAPANSQSHAALESS